jgi:hypothetical protein
LAVLTAVIGVLGAELDALQVAVDVVLLLGLLAHVSLRRFVVEAMRSAGLLA